MKQPHTVPFLNRSFGVISSISKLLLISIQYRFGCAISLSANQGHSCDINKLNGLTNQIKGRPSSRCSMVASNSL